MKTLTKYKLLGIIWGLGSGVFGTGSALFSALAESHSPSFQSLFEKIIFLPGYIAILFFENFVFPNFENILSMVSPLSSVLLGKTIIIFLIFIVPIICSIFIGLLISSLIYSLINKLNKNRNI